MYEVIQGKEKEIENYDNIPDGMNYEYLKENADKFLENAEYLFGNGTYNLSAFNIEQAMQLYLKHLLAVKLGDFPKTHSLKRLFMEMKDICLEAYEIFEDNINTVGDIESAYISSRYFPTEFLQKEVSNMLRIAKEIRRAIQNCL